MNTKCAYAMMHSLNIVAEFSLLVGPDLASLLTSSWRKTTASQIVSDQDQPIKKNAVDNNSGKCGNIPLFHPVYLEYWTIVNDLHFQPCRQTCQERAGRFWHSRTENTSCSRQWELPVVAAIVKDYATVLSLLHPPPCYEVLALQPDQLCLTGFRHCLLEHQSTST